MRKFIVASFYAFLIFLTVTPIIVIKASEEHDQTELVVSLSQQLCGNVSALPDEAFENARLADVKKSTLCNKVNAVIHQVEAGACEGALNKLREDVKRTVTKCVASPWKEHLLSLIKCIIKLIRGIIPGPRIHHVSRCPDMPKYNDYVLVSAYVTSFKCLNTELPT